MLARLEKDVLSKNPTWLILSCGVNDAVWKRLPECRENMRKIIDATQAKGIKVIILTESTVFEDLGSDVNKQLVSYNEFLRALAKEKGCPLADVDADWRQALTEYQKTAQKNEKGEFPNHLTTDGVHPNVRGHRIFATRLLRDGFGFTAEELDRAEPLRDKIEKTCRIVGVNKWYGCERIMFDFRGRTAWVVEPNSMPLPGKPWTWTMIHPTAFVPETGVPELLARGFHHVTIDCFKEGATDEALKDLVAFQEFLVTKLGFSSKVDLVGLSWGGFFSVRYASAYPQNVRKIYLDAPLLNFDRFGLDIGVWKESKPTSNKWEDDPRMPINQAEKLATAKIPVLLFYGDVDTTVVPTVNCEPFIERFKQAGGDVTVVKREKQGHHPHGAVTAEERKTLIDFFIE